jgi:hypothetical protein
MKESNIFGVRKCPASAVKFGSWGDLIKGANDAVLFGRSGRTFLTGMRVHESPQGGSPGQFRENRKV